MYTNNVHDHAHNARSASPSGNVELARPPMLSILDPPVPRVTYWLHGTKLVEIERGATDIRRSTCTPCHIVLEPNRSFESQQLLPIRGVIQHGAIAYLHNCFRTSIYLRCGCHTITFT